uniref:Uncharacterized protein n=1 Tax=Globodera pallida TaxID=36090 RepID=A0A183C894_GLOPA
MHQGADQGAEDDGPNGGMADEMTGHGLDKSISEADEVILRVAAPMRRLEWVPGTAGLAHQGLLGGDGDGGKRPERPQPREGRTGDQTARERKAVAVIGVQVGKQFD